MKILRGSGVSSGIAMGHVLKVDLGVPPIYKIRLSDQAVDLELRRFDEAVAATSRQLQRIQEMLKQELGQEHSLMIQAHILILLDKHFSGRMREIIRREQVNAEWAVKVVREKIQNVYERLKDAYLKEKIHDIQDIAQRLIGNLAGRGFSESQDIYENIIVVNHEINLSLLSELSLKHLKGFAVDFGGWTSHTSIIARSLHIPSVIHLQSITTRTHTGDFLILDGSTGTVFINPDPETVAKYTEFLKIQNNAAEPLSPLPQHAPESPGGIPGTRVYLNTEFLLELDDYADLGVAGVGLFRSEFMSRGKSLEEITAGEHEAVYRALAAKTFPQTAIIRTFDLGADKVPELRDRFHETNPALGMRGIRLSIHLQEAFRRQLRGILLANDRGNLRVTFPFVSSLDEVRTATRILADVRRELAPASLPALPIGVMLEIPSTFFIVDVLADEVDFFTLGTNDLVQYTLATDRNGIQDSSQFVSAHPAVRKGLEMIRQTTAEKNKEVICCGEMAAHPFFLLVLLGIGFRSFSVNRPCLPLVRYILNQVEPGQLAGFTDALRRFNTVAEIETFFLTGLDRIFRPDFVAALMHAYHNAM